MTYSASLRPLTESDLAMLLQWRNAPAVRCNMYTQHEISESEHLQWFHDSRHNPNRHLLVAEQDGHPFGFVNIQLVDSRGKRAEWGFYLSPRGPKGRGHSLGIAALKYAFIGLELHKLCGEAFANNTRSRKLHERLGFRQESYLRDHHFDGQDYHDVIGYALLLHEWRAF